MGNAPGPFLLDHFPVIRRLVNQPHSLCRTNHRGLEYNNNNSNNTTTTNNTTNNTIIIIINIIIINLIYVAQHQQSLYHVFVDFKKAFDRVWHAALWATMRLYNINDNLIRTIECLYNKATSAVYHDNNIGEWFRTTTGVSQGCLLSPILFNIFLERTMADALEGTVSIGGRTITNLCFADDIGGLAGQEQELVKLVNHLEEASTAYGMQISAEKTQLMTNNTNGVSTDITIDNKKLETVRSFKYLGAIV